MKKNLIFSNKGKVSTTLLIGLLSVFVIILIVSISLYIWQDNTINRLSKENQVLMQELSILQNKVKDLEDKLAKEVEKDNIIDDEEASEPDTPEPLTAREVIEKRSDETILAIKNMDFEKLSKIVHPDKGIRFSPYAYVDIKNDVVLSAEQIRSIATNNPVYIWGAYDGIGDPIELSFIDYYNRFIYDRDFANAEEKGFNKIIGTGNTINNAFEVYPGAIIVEYHFPYFDARYEGMDWKSLRLVFEKKDNTWFIVGIIHDEWTI